MTARRGTRLRRLLIYSQDGTGLGHLRRSLNIARALIEREPDCSVLVVGDSPAIPFFAPFRGLDFLKLPTVVKTGSAEWRNGSLTLLVAETLRLRSRLIADTFTSFRPDAVLVDHLPVGARGELKAMLERAARPPRPLLFLGLRDVIDAPKTVLRAWRDLGVYDDLPAYDAVLVFGCREIYDTAAAYAVEGRAQRVAYCAYATRRRAGPCRWPEN